MVGQELKAAGKHRHVPRDYSEPRTWKPEPENYIDGGFLRSLLRACGATRAECAEGAQVKPGTVRDWLRARKPIPPAAYLHLQSWLRRNPRTFDGYCRFFGIPPR